VKASWPHKVASFFGRYIGAMALSIRNALKIMRIGTTKGTGQLLFAVVVTTTVNLVIDWMQENDIEDTWFGESLDWWVALFTGVPVKPRE